ncbi:MAG: LLM class F420-dependent oxidoreductase [Candidatus Rokubacteria bacterium]|nr:LLM class F420-dependent oxidoreductase [Candidatus Rokubacteria bacterium]
MANRLGVVLPFVPTFTAPEFVDLAREVEERGYHTAWTGETGGADAVTVMTLVLSHTRRLAAATGVVPIQTRTPVMLGMTAATLGHVAPGRFTLGLGVSSRIIVEQWHGVPFVPGLGQMREAVQIMRMVWSGERVNFDGKHYRLRNYRLLIPPPAPAPKIVLAALGAQMLELAGEIADGVLLNWIGPETVGAAIRHLEAGARRAGRTLDGFEIGAFIRTCVTDDPAKARETLARDITGYAIVDVYADYFRAAGFADEVDAVNAAWKAGDRAGAVTRLSPRVLDALGVVGPEAACRARIAEFHAAGLTLPVVLPFAPPGGDRQASVSRTIRAFPA